MANKDFSGVKTYSGKNTAPAKKDSVPALTQMLSDNLKKIKSVLPKHLTPERIARVALNVIRHNPKLCQCAPETLLAAIMEAASLGLEIDMRGQAYLVPFFNGKTKTYDVQLIPGYKGLIDLTYRSGKVASIMAEAVCENDKFNFAMGLEPRLEHVPALHSRGEIIAAYAVAVMHDGTKQFSILSRDDLDKIRSASKSANDGPWKDWEAEMCKKSAIKRLCKYLPLSSEIQKAAALDDAYEAGEPQIFDVEKIDAPMPEFSMPQPERAPQEMVTDTTEPASEDEDARSNYEFPCPKNDKPVTESDCEKCPERKGCPQWEVM